MPRFLRIAGSIPPPLSAIVIRNPRMPPSGRLERERSRSQRVPSSGAASMALTIRFERTWRISPGNPLPPPANGIHDGYAVVFPRSVCDIVRALLQEVDQHERKR